MMERIVILLVAVGAAAAMALAAPAPATQPAPDFSSPMATLRTNKLALKSGDAALLKRCYHTTNADEEKAIDVIMDSSASQVRFQEACAKKFGEDAADRVAPGFNLNVPADAREEIEGDRAKLYNIGGAKPTTLRRVNGEWKFTYASLVDNNFRDLPPMAPTKLAQVFQTGVEMYKGLIAEVGAGKFAAVEDAMRALQTRQQERWTKIQQIIGEPTPAK